MISVTLYLSSISENNIFNLLFYPNIREEYDVLPNHAFRWQVGNRVPRVWFEKVPWVVRTVPPLHALPCPFSSGGKSYTPLPGEWKSMGSTGGRWRKICGPVPTLQFRYSLSFGNWHWALVSSCDERRWTGEGNDFLRSPECQVMWHSLAWHRVASWYFLPLPSPCVYYTEIVPYFL